MLRLMHLNSFFFLLYIPEDCCTDTMNEGFQNVNSSNHPLIFCGIFVGIFS